ncbi:hypothetical protein [Mycobacterium asiaticum]|uniref:hypothetical protein n=1 Tax=Mycobacterium asiaticum TaxID=1790 RepID=UPI0007EFF145|nr:hypothetical protein [Mycobacterium asiaticum]OBI97583.1 hypothetical protein A5661_17485 [Mycobacterium asiaticum]
MSETKPPPDDSATSKADAMALLEEAEAEAAEAEALAAAARARARAARLRREMLARAEGEAAETEAAEATDAADTTDAETTDVEAADEATDAADTIGAEEEAIDAEATEVVAVDPEAEAEPTDAEAPAADAEAEDPDADEVEESDSDSDEETVEAAALPSRSSRWRRRRPSLSTTLKVAAIILTCAFVAASGYMLWYEHNANERHQRAANFVAGAKQGVINMTSLDFNRAKEDVQRLLESSTGEFRDDFAQRAKDFVTVVEQSKVVTQGTITATAVESMSDNSASVLVTATSRITNAAGAKDEPRVWRLRVTVTEEGGQYKMSKLEFVA